MDMQYNTTAETTFTRIATFKRKPLGIILMDSYNNKWFPLKRIQFDKTTSNLRTIKNEFHQNFLGMNNDLFLPWHYTVELIGKDYVTIVTRTLTYKSLIPEYNNYIVICIVGDSKKDMYTPKLYKTIAHSILNPLHYIPGWKLKQDGLAYHNIGDSFMISQLEKEFR